VFALVAVVFLLGLSGAMIAVSGAAQREVVDAAGSSKALYAAEAGVSQGIEATRAGLLPKLGTLDLGTQAAPTSFAGGTYWGNVTDNGDGTVTVLAYATVTGNRQGVEVVLGEHTPGIYDSALFAGNTSGDANYDLEFGGLGHQADQINGNVYSGGNIDVTGDATIHGELQATGSIGGGSGETGASLPVPDIDAEEYETNHDYDVAASFAASSYSAKNSLGGTAKQLPEADPSHIFRLNPSDRKLDITSTTKDDYFLEDPYEAVNSSSTVNEQNATHITLSGQDGNPGPNGSEKVYYIDGNLWVHNKKIFSFKFANSAGDPVRVTFVVKGNIYFSDNILYEDPVEDGVAFIAIEDAGEQDSGNIYFGDPVFGTLEQMDSFMYAQNDFYDNNLDAFGSKTVSVNGNMTAGNQVLINRDYGTQHSKLSVNFDDRISTGAITLPGLPGSDPGEGSYRVASWREVAHP
jgi:hypothetical protein